MDQTTLARLFRGSYHFLRVTPEELRRILPDFENVLPKPQRIFLSPEERTPLQGFPVLITERSEQLEQALATSLRETTDQEIRRAEGRDDDGASELAAWRAYRDLLSRAMENAIRSSFGRRQASIFWLFHASEVAKRLGEVRARVAELGPDLPDAEGARIKYRVFNRYLERILDETFGLVERLAAEAEEEEPEVFPKLLERMRDNVLVFTEDEIGADLEGLEDFLEGCLGLDAVDFRARFARLEAWYEEELNRDRELRNATNHLVIDRRSALESWAGLERSPLFEPGYVRFLSTRPGWDVASFPTAQQVETWESLVPRLKEFEALLTLRRLVMPVREVEGELLSSTPCLPGSSTQPLQVILSSSTRPLDFMSSWVVDPQVERFGLIYDITDFSAIVTELRERDSELQDQSYHRIFRFQRWVNQLARTYRMKLEKYLGDGALFSGRHPNLLVVVAIRLQRYYRRSVEGGFPFDRGMRIGLNYGQYRLLPIEDGDFGGGLRYEFFGHGIIELSRLVTGKSRQELEEIKRFLQRLGYSDNELESFLYRAPETAKPRSEKKSGFHCHLDEIGSLVNESIVATHSFVANLQAYGGVSTLRRGERAGHEYVVLELEAEGERMMVGVRKLGLASLKGLGRVEVHEIVDGEPWEGLELDSVGADTLADALEQAASRGPRQLPLIGDGDA